MNRKFLHALAVPEQVLERPRGDQSGRVASEGTLTDDVAAVQAVSPNPGEQTFAGVVGGVGARLTAAEIEELFGASGVEVVQLFGDEPDPQADGYYATEEVGIPARASDIRWHDRRGTGDTESATAVRTVTGQHADIDIYDASNSSFTDPALVYDVAYADEWPVDVRVWDDRGDPRRADAGGETTGGTVGSATVGGGSVGSDPDRYAAWQRVYRTDHQTVGTLRIENDRLQVALDEDRGRLIARRWDESDGQYEPVQLDVTSDWRLERADVRYIGLEGVEARLRFGDGSSTHRFDAALKRGYDDVLFVNAPNAGSAPSGLTTRLDGIAHDSDRDPAGTADIVVREAL